MLAMMQPTSVPMSSTRTKQKLALKPSVVLTKSPAPKTNISTSIPLPSTLEQHALLLPAVSRASSGVAPVASPPIAILPMPVPVPGKQAPSMVSTVPEPDLNNVPAFPSGLSTPIHLRKAPCGPSSGLASPVKYAGSKFSSSPSPKSLPIPVFSLKAAAGSRSKTSPEADAPAAAATVASSSLSSTSPSLFSEATSGTLSSSLPNITEHFSDAPSSPLNNPFLSLHKDLSFPTVSGSSPLAAASSRCSEGLNASTSASSATRKSKVAHDTPLSESQSAPGRTAAGKKPSPGRARAGKASAPASAAMPQPMSLPLAVNAGLPQAKPAVREHAVMQPASSPAAASAPQSPRRRAKSTFQPGQPNHKTAPTSRKENSGRPRTQPNLANACHRSNKDMPRASLMEMDHAHVANASPSLAEISNHLKQLLNIVDGPKA